MNFKSETLATSLEEAKPLLYKHWDEIAHYKDIALDPDYEVYQKLEKNGMLQIFTARDAEGKIEGYAVFVLMYNPHYKKSLIAKQDIIYIDKQRRGIGMFFIRWCDDKLKEMGVQVVCHHVKEKHNFGPALERIGYELQDLLYTKRLDQ